MRKQKRSNESSTRLDRIDRKTTYRDFIFDQLASLVQKRATKSHKSQFERKAQYTLGGNASAPVIRHYYADSARARAVERRSGGSRPWCLLAGTRARVQRAAAVAHPHRDRQIVRNGRVHRSPKGREPARARSKINCSVSPALIDRARVRPPAKGRRHENFRFIIMRRGREEEEAAARWLFSPAEHADLWGTRYIACRCSPSFVSRVYMYTWIGDGQVLSVAVSALSSACRWFIFFFFRGGREKGKNADRWDLFDGIGSFYAIYRVRREKVLLNIFCWYLQRLRFVFTLIKLFERILGNWMEWRCFYLPESVFLYENTKKKNKWFFRYNSFCYLKICWQFLLQ